MIAMNIGTVIPLFMEVLINVYIYLCIHSNFLNLGNLNSAFVDFYEIFFRWVQFCNFAKLKVLKSHLECLKGTSHDRT